MMASPADAMSCSSERLVVATSVYRRELRMATARYSASISSSSPALLCTGPPDAPVSATSRPIGPSPARADSVGQGGGPFGVGRGALGDADHVGVERTPELIGDGRRHLVQVQSAHDRARDLAQDRELGDAQ